jgi:Domain of unknown function (DUF4148)
MKYQFAAVLSMLVIASVGVVSNASAQENTRAEVRQELVQADNNGPRFVTDTSYLAVNPIFAQQVARLQASTSGEGPVISGLSAAGKRSTNDFSRVAGRNMNTCVGPADFCTPYFGS